MPDSNFEKAIYEAVMPEIDEIMPKNAEKHEFSPKFRKRAKKLISRVDHPLKRFENTTARRAAVIVLCAFVSLATLTVGTAAVFPDTFHFVLDRIGEYIGVTFDSKTPDIEDIIGEVITPKYIPDDFNELFVDRAKLSVYICYSDDTERTFSYSQHPITDLSLMLDSSYSPEMTEVCGREAVLFRGSGKILMWTDGCYIFNISDYDNLLSDEDIIKIGESLYD